MTRVNQMMRWSARLAIGSLMALVLLYIADWTIYKLRGSPTSSVTVSQFQTIPLKGNKIEYDFIGTGSVSCSVSLFPQDGRAACWRLRRNPNQTIDL